MDTIRHTAARGLFYVFIGTVITVCSILPFIGGLFAAAGGILALYGIYIASKVHPNYRNALYADLLGILANIVMLFVGAGAAYTTLDILDSIFSLSAVYFICMATAELLSGISTKLVIWANRIWMTYLFCTIISIAGLVVAVFAPALAGFLSFIAALISVTASVFYLIFLYKAQDALKGA